MADLAKPLTLPCGAILPNRIAKAAMTEGMATPDGRPTPRSTGYTASGPTAVRGC